MPFDYYHRYLQEQDGLCPRANLREFLDDQPGEDQDEFELDALLDSREVLDLTEPAAEPKTADREPYKKNAVFSSRGLHLYGEVRLLVPGKDQIQSVEGTVTYYIIILHII